MQTNAIMCMPDEQEVPKRSVRRNLESEKISISGYLRIIFLLATELFIVFVPYMNSYSDKQNNVPGY